MKRILSILVCVLGLNATAQERLTQYVNPFVGTDGYGNVYPGAQIPFGGIQISPDTDSDFYDAAVFSSYIIGFQFDSLKWNRYS